MENEVQPITPLAQPLPQTPTLAPFPTPPSTNWAKIILLSVLGLIVVVGAVLIGVQVGKGQTPSQQPIVTQPTVSPTQAVVSPTTLPTTSVTETPAVDSTTSWKTYTNIAGYLIRYPTSFTTGIQSAGSGNVEADSATRNLFFYKSNASEPYVERYVNLEIFQVKPTYGQGTITKVTIDNQTVEKIVIPNAKFDIYSAEIGSQAFIEINVSNDPTKKEIANQILSTLKLTN